MKLKKVLAAALCVLLALLCMAGCGKKIGIHHAEITVKDYGVISVELDGTLRPSPFRILWIWQTTGFMTT